MKPSRDYLKFLSPYEPRVRKLALATRALVLDEAPGSIELIYDAYSAVASGYSFTGRPSDSFIHIAVYSKWVNLGFNQGSQLDDPGKVLVGAGNWIRHIRISEPSDLERPIIRDFVRMAVARADRPEKENKSKSVVRAIYPKKRRPPRIL